MFVLKFLTNIKILLVALLLLGGAPYASVSFAEVHGIYPIRIGDIDAPHVLNVLYSSMCGFCRKFEEQVLSRFQYDDLVKMGKVRVELIHYPIGSRAMVINSMIACVTVEHPTELQNRRAYNLLKTVYRNQEALAYASKGRMLFKNLKMYFVLAGYSDKEFQACVDDKSLLSYMKSHKSNYVVKGTPTILLDGDKRIAEGFIDYDDLKRAIVSNI